MNNIPSFCALCVFFLGIAQAAEQPEPTGKRILLVQSYHEGYAWNSAIAEGVVAALKDTGHAFEVFYMDTKRRTTEEWKVRSGELAKEKVSSFRPHVVICTDDNAQQYFAKDYADVPGAPQFIFCGVNAEPSAYGYPASNVTGILERPHLADSLKMLLRIKPDVRRVVLLSDDGPTSDAAFAFMKTVETPVRVEAWEQPSTFDEWKEAVRKAQNTAQAIVLYNYHTVKREAPPEPKEGEGAEEQAVESMDPAEVIAWTYANSRIPMVGLFDFAVEDGAICGIVESGQEHGYESAMMARAIVEEGKQARDFPIRTARKGTVMLNLKAAQKLRLRIPYSIIRTARVVIRPE